MKDCGINYQILDLRKINKIYCFGTSFTEGGGYYFNSPNLSKLQNEYYDSFTEYPKTMYNYSYPGQLKKLFNDNISVKNFGKCGYGDDRTARLIYDLVENKTKEIDNTLFLIELSYLGREELYSNDLKSYVVHNYSVGDDLNYIKGNLAITHQYDSSYHNTILDILSREVSKYNNKFWNYEATHNKHNRNNVFLLSYLIKNNINFIIIEGAPDKYIEELDNNRSLINFSPNLSDTDKYSINHMIADKKLTIDDDTSGKLEDYHASLEGNKLISSKIYENIIKIYNFE